MQWWKQAVVYQIYPRSFADSNGDGIGDLQGILSKLDYLEKLGVDVLWLSPIYRSPNDDNGYDISDYRNIMDEFGSMDDFDALLFAAHSRGLKIVMDLVVNHTSDEHNWFVESRKSKDNPFRDYYFWSDEPNNWVSCFGGSAWKYDPQTSQYYLHIFSEKQPDLNWENDAVKREVYDMMRFWLDKGIDGFRMDVINFISKEKGLPNAHSQDERELVWGGEYFMNGPNVHEILQDMNRHVLSKYEIMTVGETPGVTPEDAALYTSESRRELNMIFQFEHMELDSTDGDKWTVKPWSLHDLKQVMTKWQTGLHNVGWNSLYLNNHDQPRMVSRFGNDARYRVESAKMLATFLHMMQGTPYIYQGEEIGMTNVRFPSIDDYRDVETLNVWRERVTTGNTDATELMDAIYKKGRDNARTPMQWDAGPNAGFTTGQPWIGLNPNYKDINVKGALADPNSIFYYYQTLIQLRKKYDVIVHGDYELLLPEHEEIYAYRRTYKNEELLVLSNFYEGTPVLSWPVNGEGKTKKLLISNYPENGDLESSVIRLRPYEARVYLITK